MRHLTRRALLGALSATALAAPTRLEDRWSAIAASVDGTLGIAALHLESGRHASRQGAERFPLASVCKLPLAMHMLALVDEGKHTLDEKIEIPPQEVAAWVSPLADRWPAERAFALDEMLLLMVAQSDNTAVDTLLRVGGGPAAMAARFRQWGIEGIRIDRTEAECGLYASGYDPVPPMSGWTREKRLAWTREATPAMRAAGMRKLLADPRDTATPDSTVELLARLYRGELLSPASTARMITILEATGTAPHRLKGLLPAGTVVGHKTGTTATAGINGSTNDVGVVTLAGGRGRMAIAIYLKGSTADDAARDGAIARAARAAYDEWSS